MRGEAPGIAVFDVEHARHLAQDLLHAPEAAAGQQGDLGRAAGHRRAAAARGGIFRGHRRGGQGLGRLLAGDPDQPQQNYRHERGERGRLQSVQSKKGSIFHRSNLRWSCWERVVPRSH